MMTAGASIPNGVYVSTIERQAASWKAADCVSILVTGRSGTGKHDLVRGLLGEAPQCSSSSEPHNLPQCKVHYQGVCFSVSFWSLPELNAEEYWKAVTSLLRNLDLVIYAVRMDDTRLRPEDMSNLRRLTQDFGEQLWEKGIVALTFANKVTHLNDRQVMIRSEAFSKIRANEFKTRISNLLAEEGRMSDLPFIPAGYFTEPRLFEGVESWVSQLLKCAIVRMGRAGRGAGGGLWKVGRSRVQLDPTDTSVITCHQ